MLSRKNIVSDWIRYTKGAMKLPPIAVSSMIEWL